LACRRYWWFACNRYFKKIKTTSSCFTEVTGDDKAQMEFPLNNRFMCEALMFGLLMWRFILGNTSNSWELKWIHKLFICGTFSYIKRYNLVKDLNLLHMNPGAYLEFMVFTK
jgi:hypothetical protein